MTDSLDMSRLKWACRRGMLELDLLLGDFLEHDYAQLSAQEREDFERLLRYPDQELYDFFMKNQPPPEEVIARLVETIRRAAHNRAKALV